MNPYVRIKIVKQYNSNIIQEYYNSYKEEIRLNKDNAHKVEFLTSIKYITDVLPEKAKILDACAGVGAYSFYLADLGYDVVAGDVVENHVSAMKKINDEKKSVTQILKTDVMDLSQFEDNSFDAVLCMGALYHLRDEADRKRAVSECLRVLRKDGIFVAAYINRYAKILKDMLNGLENMDIAMQVFRKGNSPQEYEGEAFYKTTPSEFIKEAEAFALETLFNIGTDGISYAISDKINEMTNEQFETWLEYHMATCKDFSILGYSMHGLYIGKKL